MNKRIKYLTLLSVIALVTSSCIQQQVELNKDAQRLSYMLTGKENNLQKAILNKDAKVVEKLLSKGIDPNTFEEGTHSPLYLALNNSKGRTEIIALLLNAGAKVNEKELRKAVSVGHPQPLRLLLESGAKIPAPSSSAGNIFSSIECYSVAPVECAELLLQAGAKVTDTYNGSKYTSLHSNARGGHPQLVGFLVKNGLDINAKDEKGRTPLGTGVTNATMIQELIKHGANVNAQDNEGNTPLMNEYLTDIKAINALLQAGANPNIRNKKGENAVSYCINHQADVGGMIEGEDGTITTWHGYGTNETLLNALIKAGGKED